MNSGLAMLHLRRGLRPWLFVAALVLVLLVLNGDPPQQWLGEESAAGAWRRRELWGAALLVFWPVALLRAASLVGDWRAGELDWLAPRVTNLGRALFASWVGGLAALLIGVGAVAAIAEATGGDSPKLVDRGSFEGTEVATLDRSVARAWTLDLPPTQDGAQLAVALDLLGYRGPAVDAGVVVRRDGSEARWEGRLGRAREVLVPLPPGDGPVQVTLERLSDGAAISMHRPAARLYAPAGSFASFWGLMSRIALAAALSLALAIGFGAWVSTPSAMLAVVALWICVWIGDAPWPLPGDDLFGALDALGRGRAAGAIPLRSAWVTLAGVAFGLGLAQFGLSRQRRAA